MKQQETKKTGMQTAARYRRRRMEKIICMLLRIVLVLTTILFCWITDLGCAFGWMRNARAGENWPLEFVGYGQMMVAASAFLTLGVVLVLLCRRNWLNWAAVGAGSTGIILCLIALYRVSSYAADSGFYSKLMDMPVDTLYRMEILPTLVPYGCLVLLAWIQFFSVEARDERMGKKQREEAKAPSILEKSSRKSL